MTEVSSTGEAAGVESGRLRRSAVPAPPRPPAPPVRDDGGPATSAMSPVAAGDLRQDQQDELTEPPYLVDQSYTRLTPAVPVTGTPSGSVPPPPKVRRDRRPQVTVRGPRRAKLVVRRVDPWSVLKFSFLFSICMLIVWVVTATALLSLLRTMHVFDNINTVLATATSSDATNKGFRVDPTMHDVRLWAAILGAVNALLFTALATLGAFLYNLISMLVGGIEVTLGERD
jgi:hypothetical protein